MNLWRHAAVVTGVFVELATAFAAPAYAIDGRANDLHAAATAELTTKVSMVEPASSGSVSITPQGAGFSVPRHIIAGGGGRSVGGAFAITGTIGQANADPLQPSTGGVFAITGGFWPGITAAAPLGDPVFANGFEPSVP